MRAAIQLELAGLGGVLDEGNMENVLPDLAAYGAVLIKCAALHLDDELCIGLEEKVSAGGATIMEQGRNRAQVFMC